MGNIQFVSASLAFLSGFFRRKWPLFLVLIFVGLFTSVKGQKPLDIGEYVQAPETDMFIYLPFENSFENLGSGSFSLIPNGSRFSNGVKGKGVEFDGFDDWLRVQPGLLLYQDFTISFWVEPYTMNSEMGIFSIRDQCDDNFRGFSMAYVGFNSYQVENLSYQVNKHLDCWGYSGGDRYKPAFEDILPNEKTFIAVSVSRNEQEGRIVQFYKNCVLVGSEEVLNFDTYEAFYPHNYITTIGANSIKTDYIHSFNGTIDEFRFYNRMLSADELYSVYRNAVGLEVKAERYVSCEGDSAMIELRNSELFVDYQLFNQTKQQWVGHPVSGDCEPIYFSTGLCTEESDFVIFAKHQISGMELVLDTVFMLEVASTHTVIHNGFSKCEGEYVIVGGNYIYSDTVIFDTIYNGPICDTILETSVFFFKPPSGMLGRDTSICSGTRLPLRLNCQNCTFLWSNGVTDSAIVVSAPDDYWVNISRDGCSWSDTIRVDVVDCDCKVYFPNAFSPNGDGENDKYGPSSNCTLLDYYMVIVNRWGQIIFESGKDSVQWDGTSGGSLCPVGVYGVYITYRKSEGDGLETHYGLILLFN